MKFFHKGKDGGPESTVTGYWLIEWKGGFSIALLKFDNGSREAYHDHAFNAISWLLSGELHENVKLWWEDYTTYVYTPSWRPIITTRDNMHKVSSKGRSWALTFRGPWKDTWNEYFREEDRHRTLASGRVEVDTKGV